MSEKNGTIHATLGELVAAEAFLQKVCALPLRDAKTQPEGLTPKVRYHLMKLGRLVAAETKHFAMEQQAAFADLGIVEGQKVTDLKPGVWADYQRRMKATSEVEVEIDWRPVSSMDIPLALASDVVGLGPLCELVEPPEEGAK